MHCGAAEDFVYALLSEADTKYGLAGSEILNNLL
jgi:hypothetical protein